MAGCLEAYLFQDKVEKLLHQRYNLVEEADSQDWGLVHWDCNHMFREGGTLRLVEGKETHDAHVDQHRQHHQQAERGQVAEK